MCLIKLKLELPYDPAIPPLGINPEENHNSKRHIYLSVPGVGNGSPLQCSCLENFMDRGTFQGRVQGVAKNWT